MRKFVPAREAPGAVVSPEVTAREEQFLPVIEDAATQKVALRFRYYSASRGSEDTRHASVHRVTPSRFREASAWQSRPAPFRSSGALSSASAPRQSP